jgi:hypothetical protein
MARIRAEDSAAIFEFPDVYAVPSSPSGVAGGFAVGGDAETREELVAWSDIDGGFMRHADAVRHNVEYRVPALYPKPTRGQ